MSTQRYRIVFSYLMDMGASALGVPQVMRHEDAMEIEAKTSAAAVDELCKAYPPESEFAVLSITRLSTSHALGPTPGELVVRRIEHEKGKNTRAQLDHVFEVNHRACYSDECRIGGSNGAKAPHFTVARIPWSEHAEADAHLFSAARDLLMACEALKEAMHRGEDGFWRIGPMADPSEPDGKGGKVEMLLAAIEKARAR